MYNDDQLLMDTIRYIDDLLGKGTAQPIERMTGSEDFSALPSKCRPFCTGLVQEVRKKAIIMVFMTAGLLLMKKQSTKWLLFIRSVP